MDALRPAHPGIPADLSTAVRSLQHDIQRARQHYLNGHLKPEHYDAVHRVLSERLQMLEAQVQQRLLAESRMSRLPKGFALN